MIDYEEYKVISIETLEEFLSKKGFNHKLIREVFCDMAENNSYIFWDLDRLGYAIEYEQYFDCPEAVEILNHVVDAIKNNEIPEEFLLNVYW